MLGEALGDHLPPIRMVRLIRTLPGGAVILRRYPDARNDPGVALQAIWREGLASQFRARAAALSVPLLTALDNAGWVIPGDDPYGDTSADLTPPVFVPTLRTVTQTIRHGLEEVGGPPVVLCGPDHAVRSAITALVVEDPRVHLAFPGGVFVSQMTDSSDLLDVLRDIGAAIDHARLARAADVEPALHLFRTHFRQKRMLLVLDGVSDIRWIRRLWGGLGPSHRLLVTSDQPVPAEVPVQRIRVPTQSPEEAWEQLLLWAGPVAQTNAGRSLAHALATRPGLVVRCARLLGGRAPWLSPAELLAAMASVSQHSVQEELEDAALSIGLQTAPPVLAETMLALSVLPHAPATLPDDLMGTIVGAERWDAVRDHLATAGLVTCLGTGRWQIPLAVSRVIRRRSAQVPQLAASARRAAVHWARRRLTECAKDWTGDGVLSLRMRELRADRRALVGLIGRDPLGALNATEVPFGLVAWLLPHDQVRTLIARSSKLAGHPWRGSAWRWLAADLLRTNRRQDAARLLSAVVEDARRIGALAEQLDASLRLARVQHERGNVVDARALLEAAVRDAGDAGDTIREASACLALGELLDVSGDAGGAVQAHWRAVALFRDSGRPSMAAEATGRLGQLAQRSGNLEVAEERFRMQAALADAAHDRRGVTTAESRLGCLAWAAGDPETAVRWLGRALKGWEEGHAGNDPIQVVFATFTEALLATGQTEAALATCRRRIDEARTSGDLTDETAAVGAMARILASMGARSDALRLLSDALQRDRALGDRRGEALHLLEAGRIHDPRRAPRRAVVCFEAARHVAEEVGWRAGLARALEGVATAEVVLNQLPQAVRNGRGALEIYRRLGDPHSIARWEVQFGGILVAGGHPNEGHRLISTGARALADLGWAQERITKLVTGSTARSIGA